VLFPRLTENEKQNISNPAHGLLVYQTDGKKGFYYYNSTVWKLVGSESCNLQIGDEHQGGIIIYLDSSGCHGLIAGKKDLDCDCNWYIPSDSDSFIKFYAFRNGIGAGKLNTELILNKYKDNFTNENDYFNSAAFKTSEYVEGNYGDWYLPSRYELNLLNDNIGETYSLTSAANIAYWSSNEIRDANIANGAIIFWPFRRIFLGYPKNLTLKVRPIRIF
jgi:hypothetical protein